MSEIDDHPLRYSQIVLSVIEPVLFRRTLENRLVGSTLETALEIADAVQKYQNPTHKPMTIIIKPMDGAEVSVNEDSSLIFRNWNIQNTKPIETRDDPLDVPLAICDWLRSRILAERPGYKPSN